FFFQAEDGIRDRNVTGVQTCALPILVDQLGDCLLLHRLVDDVEGQTLGHDLEQQRTADSGVDDTGILHHRAVLLLDGLVDTYLRSEERRVGKEGRRLWAQAL